MDGDRATVWLEPAPDIPTRRLSPSLDLPGWAGCRTAFLNGNFVSVEQLPNDYDGVRETAGVDAGLLDPVMLDFSCGRAAMKTKYGGELFPASMPASPGVPYLDFFQQDRNGTPKGVVELRPGNFT